MGRNIYDLNMMYDIEKLMFLSRLSMNNLVWSYGVQVISGQFWRIGIDRFLPSCTLKAFREVVISNRQVMFSLAFRLCRIRYRSGQMPVDEDDLTIIKIMIYLT